MADERAAQFTRQALEHLRADRFPQAAEFARQAVELDPESGEAHGALGIALAHMGRTAEATDALKRSVELLPGDAKARYNLAAHLFRIGERDAALRQARAALEIQPTHRAALELVRQLERMTGSRPPDAPPAPPPVEPSDSPGGSVYQPGAPIYYDPGAAPRPLHSMAFIERMGSAWDGVLWVTWTLNLVATVAFYVVVYTRIVPGAESMDTASPSQQMQFFDDVMTQGFGWGAAAVLMALAMMAVWIVDIADRRPAATGMTLGVIGAVLAPCCMCYLNILSIVIFVGYFVATRRYT